MISNKYFWSECFFKSINLKPIWLEEIDQIILSQNSYHLTEIDVFSWDNILKKSNLHLFLKNLLS